MKLLEPLRELEGSETKGSQNVVPRVRLAADIESNTSRASGEYKAAVSSANHGEECMLHGKAALLVSAGKCVAAVQR